VPLRVDDEHDEDEDDDAKLRQSNMRQQLSLLLFCGLENVDDELQ
jgi:hypothetical protein